MPALIGCLAKEVNLNLNADGHHGDNPAVMNLHGNIRFGKNNNKIHDLSGLFVKRDMKTKTKIKIIKKGTEKIIEKSVIANKKSEPNDVSKLTSTISGWITEFQQQRQRDTESAIERFNS